jgi:hypothetical protein
MALLKYLGTTIAVEAYIHEDLNEYINFLGRLPAFF